METDPFPAIFLFDIEYSVITCDVIKSFDCIIICLPIIIKISQSV